jgi:hypothetical protein
LTVAGPTSVLMRPNVKLLAPAACIAARVAAGRKALSAKIVASHGPHRLGGSFS